jgi:hypothetical protein
MHLLLLRFTVPKSKLYEFDLALKRLVKWPVLKVQTHTPDTNFETFEFIRTWNNQEEMQADLSSHAFNNLVGAVKVLGQVQQSCIYRVEEESNLSLDAY